MDPRDPMDRGVDPAGVDPAGMDPLGADPMDPAGIDPVDPIGVDPGEQITGTRDEHYNMVAVLYHALKGADNCDTYALDAEAAGDVEQAAFFRDAQVMQVELAERAKGMLGIIEVEIDVEIDIVEEGGIGPGGMAGGIPPEGPMGAAGAAAGAGAMAPGTEPLDVPPTAAADVPMTDVPPTADVPVDEDIGVTGAVEPDVPVDEDVLAPEDVPTTDIPPTTDVPRTPAGAAVAPDEGIEPPAGGAAGATAPGAGTPGMGAVPRDEDVVAPEEEPVTGELPATDVPRAPGDAAAPTAVDEGVVAPEEAPTGDLPAGVTEDVPAGTTDVPRTPEATAPGGTMPGAAEPGDTAAATGAAAPDVEEGLAAAGDTATGTTDVPAETTASRIEPEDFDPTIEALRGGAANLEIERGLAEIDGWEQRLEESGDPQLAPIAENLRQLRTRLTAEDMDRDEVGRLLNTLGEQVQELASGGIGEPVAEQLQQLGGLLNTEGRDLSGQ